MSDTMRMTVISLLGHSLIVVVDDDGPGLNVLVPALLTGNCVLYKPSEHSALTGLHIVSLLHQAGMLTVTTVISSSSMTTITATSLRYTADHRFSCYFRRSNRCAHRCDWPR